MDDITRALSQFRGRLEKYGLYSQYYDGVHRLAFATEKFRNAFGDLFEAFADNTCPTVVDALADRLVVVGFGVEDGVEAAAGQAWDVWLQNRMDRRAGEVHLEAARSGDAYVIVWPGPTGAPTIYPNSGSAITVRYDEEQPGRLLWAAKLWYLEDKRYRLNMYYPDRIEKYITAGRPQGIPEKSNRFVPFEVEGERWPLANPWGQVPVFHFANNAMSGHFGRSELTDVVPLQDALNKAIADMLVAMEYVALPQRWVTGLEVPIDPITGKIIAPFVPGADRIWAVGDPQTRFGQFDPANLAHFLAVQGSLRQEIAVVSRTPVHFVIPPTGQWPSGEALKTAEFAFLAKVSDRQAAFGNVWEDVLAFALRMTGGPAVQLSTLWRDPTPRAVKEMVETALLKQRVGVSEDQNLRELGYSPDQIEKMKQERDATSAELGEKLLTAFERGD